MLLSTPEGDPPPAPSRRAIAASLFTLGYAAAIGPANAQAITTPTDGLIIEEPRLRGAGGYALPAYLARPEGRARHGAVLVVNEIFGIHAYIKDVCHRLAREGYVALAPDYFDRAGDPAPLTDIAAIRPIVAAATHEQVMGDTGSALAWLRRQRFVARARVGVTGFCWGGSVVWMAAARFRSVKAGVAWYGRLSPPVAGGFGAEPGRPWPVDRAAALRAPVLGLYAERDRGISLESVAAMRAALVASGDRSGAEIVVIPGVEHGFHADYRPSYNEAAARDGWARMLAWFRAHGVF